MSRLIDADLLMENYDLKSATKYGNKSAKQQEHSYSALMMYEIAGMIEDAPTVYDVDAVVKEIDEWNKVTGALPEHSTWYYELISIIERGGVK